MRSNLCAKARDALALTALVAWLLGREVWRWLRGDRRRQARIVVPRTNVHGAR